MKQIVIILILLLNFPLFSKNNIKIIRKENFVNEIQFKFDSIPQEKYFIYSGVRTVSFWDICNQGTGIVDLKYNSEKKEIEFIKRDIKVLNINRFDEETNDRSKNDWISSHIIDIRNYAHAVLTFEYKRGDFSRFDRGFSDNYFAGPEFRVIDEDSNIVREPDELIVDFIFADSNNLNKLINPKEEDWNVFPLKNGASIKGNPALSIFGGGGLRRAFDEKNFDSVLTYDEGLRMDLFDTGFDTYFNRATIHIPDTIRKLGFFRFRIRSNNIDIILKNHNIDDYDDFYVKDINLIDLKKDNYRVYFSNNYEFNNHLSVRAKNSSHRYNLNVILNSIASEFKMVNFNYYASISNADNNFDIFNQFDNGNLITNITNLKNLKSDFFIYKKNGNNKRYFLAIAKNNSFPNDTLFGQINFNYNNVLAYDEPDNPFNSVPYFTDRIGKGLNLPGLSSGDDNIESSCGGYGGKSGQIAVRYDLDVNQTIDGVKVLYSEMSSSPDYVKISFYKGNLNKENLIDSSVTLKFRMYDDISKEMLPGKYITHLLNKPLNLEAGTYYVVLSQLGESGFEIGGSRHRMGMITTKIDKKGNGLKNVSVFLDKSLKRENPNGKLVNYEDLFYYRNDVDKGEWIPFIPWQGNPGYSFLNYKGTKVFSDSVDFYIRGSYVPMIRILLKEKSLTYIDDKENSNQLIIYPNPVEDYLYINSEINDFIEIRNIFGELAIKTENSNKLDVSKLFPGIYFIKINNQFLKFIKK